MAYTVDNLKIDIDITYSEELTDQKVTGIFERAKAHLNHRACREIDWDNDITYRQLLIDCCKYIFSNALSEFDKEYAEELNTMYLDGLGESEDGA